jgi:hypothetical protein
VHQQIRHAFQLIGEGTEVARLVMIALRWLLAARAI